MSKKYQLLIFDWDGTIMDSTHKIVDCICAAAIDVGIEPPERDAAKNIIGLSLVPAMQRLFPSQGDEIIQQLVQSYSHQFVTSNQTEQGLFEGVQQGIQVLHEAGVFLAVATGKSRAGLDRILNQVDIKPYFMVSRCADETLSKPNPKMLHEILDYTAVDPDKSIMIGDTTFDMDMANNAGIDCLAVSYGAHSLAQLQPINPVYIANHFSQITQWFLSERLEPALAGS